MLFRNTILAMSAMAIVACSSGGGNSVSVISTDNSKVVQTAKVERKTITNDDEVTKDFASLAYTLPYSTVEGVMLISSTNNTNDGVILNTLSVSVQEPEIKEMTIPTSGVATYKGKAFSAENVRAIAADNSEYGLTGNLSYTIDFGNKTGNGKITGLSEEIILNTTNLDKFTDYNPNTNNTSTFGKVGADATVGSSSNYKYDVYLFGPNADNVAGAVYENGKSANDAYAGFAGEKQ